VPVLKRAAIYARFSTDMQRNESIDAQIEAVEKYAAENEMQIVRTYVDRAKSATSDQRPEFQNMIKDSETGAFDVVCVHKLDRFARDRYDSAFYRKKLKANGVKLISVTEQLDGSPESIILESVLEAMAEYYSKNLAREVEKGKRQNVLRPKDIDKIVDTYQFRKEEERFSRRVSTEEIVENNFNLNISRYVDTSEEEKEIDIQAVMREIKDLEAKRTKLDKEIDVYLKELGLVL